jgi:phosphoribosylformylglycinamidine synthase
MQTLRDNPECAREEFEAISNADDSGPVYSWDFDPDAPVPLKRPRPRVAILREQGVNGYVEMAAAFEAAGFESVDVHMTDLLSGEKSLEDFHGMAACGGFSYGDVLGAGSGWARSILLNPALREAFERFFRRPQTFSLGVCNGCQMLAQLKSIIPGAADWCAFSTNRSEQFEARFVNVHVEDSASVFFRDMAGSLLGIAVAHGEGRCDFSRTGSLDRLAENRMIAMRYVDGAGRPAERYPFNPNGSPKGITALTSKDGRVTVMMPHPERVFRSIQWSYRPRRLTSEFSPWIRMFQNARKFLE